MNDEQKRSYAEVSKAELIELFNALPESGTIHLIRGDSEPSPSFDFWTFLAGYVCGVGALGALVAIHFLVRLIA